MWFTAIGMPALSAPPLSCIAQPGQSRTRRVAPEAATFASFLRMSSADISGNFAENVPPNPQQLSSSADGTYSAARRMSARGASRTPSARQRWQLAW